MSRMYFNDIKNVWIFFIQINDILGQNLRYIDVIYDQNEEISRNFWRDVIIDSSDVEFKDINKTLIWVKTCRQFLREVFIWVQIVSQLIN